MFRSFCGGRRCRSKAKRSVSQSAAVCVYYNCDKLVWPKTMWPHSNHNSLPPRPQTADCLFFFLFSCIINQRWFVAKRLKAGFWRLMRSEWEFHISSPQPGLPFPRAFVFTTIVNIYYALNKHAWRSINIIESKELRLRSSVITCIFILLRIQMEISLLVCCLMWGKTTLWMGRATICLYFIMKIRLIIFSG